MLTLEDYLKDYKGIFGNVALLRTRVSQKYFSTKAFTEIMESTCRK